jgi:hypothetical protein
VPVQGEGIIVEGSVILVDWTIGGSIGVKIKGYRLDQTVFEDIFN